MAGAAAGGAEHWRDPVLSFADFVDLVPTTFRSLEAVSRHGCCWIAARPPAVCAGRPLGDSLDLLTEYLTNPIYLAASGGVLLCSLTVVMFFLGRRSGRKSGRRPTEAANGAENLLEDDLRKSVWILQNENKNLSTFLMLLPDLARELNSEPDKRKVAPLLRRMLEQIFDP